MLEFGLFDQIRVDKGTEWVLTLFVNEKLAHLRNTTEKPSHKCTSSKKVGYSLLCQLMPIEFFSLIESYYRENLGRSEPACELSNKASTE